VAQSADLFRDLDATYLHAIVIGFSEALRRGSHLDWREVLEFCRGILTQPDFKRPYMPPEYEDPDWMWTRRDIGSLLQIGLEQEQAQIPIKLREAVWPLIEILAQDQQPSEKDEERKENNFDPVLSALNTVRGIGVQLAIRYALWVRKATDNFTMKSAPEVSALLKSKLLISKEPTLTVRSVFGQWFPWLMLLDPEWTQSIVDDIFPDSHKLARYWQAAWGSYVGYCSAYDVVYPALSRKYERAVAEINAKWSIEMAHTDPQKRLAEHLVAYYWRGLLPQKLLQQFFHKASEPIQEHGLEVIGRSLDAPSAPSGQVLDRLRDLYEWLLRRKKMRPSPQPQFAAFGYWFASGIFESNWSLRALRTSLQMAGDIEAAEKVLERMKGLVKENSGLVLECLAILVSQDQELWQIDSWQEHIHQILSSVEEPISEDSKKWMSEIANRMGEMGYLQFRRFAA
jgi:hypothetical protein